MNADNGTILSLQWVRLVTAVAALLAAPSLARSEQEPGKREVLPDGVTKVTAEDLRSRVPNFFYFDYEFGPRAGKRLWLPVNEKRWIERYPDGKETPFRMLGRARTGGVSGTVVVRLVGDPDGKGVEEDDRFQVVIPDKGDEPMRLFFRTVEDGPGDWTFLGEMKKVE
jgi:hypothetical protein